MKSIAVLNQKGGVGKTTLAASLASALIERGRFVSLIDLDPQGCLSLLAPQVEQIRPRELPKKLRRHAASDYVLIDTPPSMGARARIAADLADGVIIPTLAEFLALRGLATLLATVDPGKIIGLVVIGYRGYTKHHRRVLQKLGELGYPILALIPFSISASDAGLNGKDLISYSPAKARGIVRAYQKLAMEVDRWAKID